MATWTMPTVLAMFHAVSVRVYNRGIINIYFWSLFENYFFLLLIWIIQYEWIVTMSFLYLFVDDKERYKNKKSIGSFFSS